MCTVTYIPQSNNNFIFTSNRDETPLRKTIPPKEYLEKGTKLLFPKDEIAGGTWIGLSEKKRLVCLLNGGFELHKRVLPYKMSRGVIVKELLVAVNTIDFINTFDFDKIEPFTVVILDWETELTAHEFVWDGRKVHLQKLDNTPKIWSSSTLYTQEMKNDRKNWFSDFLKQNKEVQQEDVLSFHKNKNLGTKETSVKMKRKFVETVSVTSVQKNENKVDVSYFDILKNNKSNITFITNK